MKTFVALALSSAAFGAAIAITYWFVAHAEVTGTLLLGLMTGAFVFTAAFALVAERNADVAGDSAEAAQRDASGEDLGIFTTESAWPILVALCAALVLVGVMYSPLLGGVAFAALVACLVRLGAESNRT